MKNELKFKFLQFVLNKKKEDEGFTLIELLVVIIIIGILAAIALPSLLSNASKARQSEAKQYVGTINRAQQAFYLENNNEFTTIVTELALGIKPTTENYTYDLKTDKPGTYVTNKGRALKKSLKSYAGVVFTSEQDVSGVKESVTMAIMCESISPMTADNTGGANVANGSNSDSCPTTDGGKMSKIK